VAATAAAAADVRREAGGDLASLRRQAACAAAACRALCGGFSGLALLRRSFASHGEGEDEGGAEAAEAAEGGAEAAEAAATAAAAVLARGGRGGGLVSRRRSLVAWHLWHAAAASRQLSARLLALQQLHEMRRAVLRMRSVCRAATLRAGVAEGRYTVAVRSRCFCRWAHAATRSAQAARDMSRRISLLRGMGWWGTVARERARARASLEARRQQRRRSLLARWRRTASARATCRRRAEAVAAGTAARQAAAAWEAWRGRYKASLVRVRAAHLAARAHAAREPNALARAALAAWRCAAPTS